ncbi:probable imidazolonepropionase [Nilaparvata lugens]|uniref:probable imidazolonepropionase n=1 Tax=Nilaparvata lugens TaxID=108931 RepID=UPI00193EA729|nr:probable imidazolonepropionase [Nilaparvata lugens]
MSSSSSSGSSTDTADSDERGQDYDDNSYHPPQTKPISPPLIDKRVTVDPLQTSTATSNPAWHKPERSSPTITENLDSPMPDDQANLGTFKFRKFFRKRKISPEPVKKLRMLIYNALQIATPTDEMNVRFLAGRAQNHVIEFTDNQRGGVGLAVDTNGIIEYMGNSMELKEKYEGYEVERYIDATNMTILPGFIDAHTHPIWAGDRLDQYKDMLERTPEQEQRMPKHRDYEGAIDISINTMHTDDDDIYNSLVKRLRRMVKSGTTYVECKSGYGLLWGEEVRLLRLLHRAKQQFKNLIDMSITYFGGHIRPGIYAGDLSREIVFKQIPRIKQMREEKSVEVDNIDVYCDTGVYGIDEAKHILEAGHEIGLSINFHADELSRMGGTEMGAEIGARAISCLQRVSNRGMKMMGQKGTIAVLLPAAAHLKRQDFPPARALITQNVPVALGSDFSPSISCYSMPMVMYIACACMGMTMAESFNAATLNAAATIDDTRLYGAVAVGKYADLVLIEAPRWEHIIWQYGNHNDLISYVIKKGKIVKGFQPDSASSSEANQPQHDDLDLMDVSD